MIVLDTNVVSELMKPSPSPAVVAWMSSQSADEIFTTSITIAEVLYGLELLPRGKRRDQLSQQAEAMFSEDFPHGILPFDEAAARLFALIAATRRTRGRPISSQDAQIASIVRANGATLATRNTDDFEGCGLRVINPWRT
ncbi:MAG TPA: type II toxin-antitoxin system VapC family toxin [Terracidiphilus sp.]|nr:type II toxin-antitoxin system VapC family toxin [Terracidiphilus sp.]